MSARVPAASAPRAHTTAPRADNTAGAAALLGGSGATSGSARGGTDAAGSAPEGGSNAGGTAFSSALAAAAHPSESQPQGSAAGVGNVSANSSAVQAAANGSASTAASKTSSAANTDGVDEALTSATELTEDPPSTSETPGSTHLLGSGSARGSGANTTGKARTSSGDTDASLAAGTLTNLQQLLGAAAIGANPLSSAGTSVGTANGLGDSDEDDAIDADFSGSGSAGSGASAAAIATAYSGESAANAASSALLASTAQQAANPLASTAAAAAGSTPADSAVAAFSEAATASAPHDATAGDDHSSDNSSTTTDAAAAPSSLAWGLSSLLGPGSTASAAASQLTAVPVGHAQWPQAVAAQVHMMAANGVQSATLRLSPQHLGPLEVRIDLQHSQVNVSFSAHHAETRSALAEAMPRLRELLTAGGLNLGQTHVQQESTSQSGNDGGPHSPTAGEETVESVPVSSTRSLGLIDEYA